MFRIRPKRAARKCFMALCRYSLSDGHERLGRKRSEPETKTESPFRGVIARLKLDDIDIRDVPTSTLSEAIQVICDSWDLGLNDDIRFLVPMSRIKRLLDECIAGGEAGERLGHGHAIEQQCRFDSHWQEGDEMNPRIRIDPGVEMEQDNSSTTWSEGSDAKSMTHSVFTVRSVTSYKEQTSRLVWPRNETG